MKKISIKESKIEEIIKERYSDDTILLIATSNNSIPTVRTVDTFYYDGSFWIVTDLRTNYAKEILGNKYVMISDAGHNRFWCEAVVVGHPLDETNLAIRDVYMKVFHFWYKEVNNEDLKTTCYIRVTPYKGYIHKDKMGYTFNYKDDSVIVEDIKHHIDVRLEPIFFD